MNRGFQQFKILKLNAGYSLYFLTRRIEFQSWTTACERRRTDDSVVMIIKPVSRIRYTVDIQEKRRERFSLSEIV